jgi:tetratricopeptide (TPR) repeat protein
MGKKSKQAAGLAKAANRKIDKSILPAPPPPPEDEVGSAKALNEPTLPGSGFKIINGEGFDDGGVADLSLLIDLEDNVQRRRRGENEYFQALKADLLPRAIKGPMAKMNRREQKVSLAQLLFSEDDDCEDKGPSEVYVEQVDGEEDAATMKHRADRLAQARAALRLSLLLREAACTSLSLSELCKRKLTYAGKAGATEALRCADKALEIAGSGFWDGDDIAIEADDAPAIDPKYEKNATTPGLANPTVLKLLPIRVSHLCKRSALLQRGNALAAMGREEEAIKSYTEVFPLLEGEPRCARVDWERHSLYVNIGNSHSRSGDYEAASTQYEIGEKLGEEHVEAGNVKDGKGMVACSRRARSFALRRAGRMDEAKKLLRQVLHQQIKDDMEADKLKAEKAAEDAAKAAEEAAKKKEES